jgi:hypothetical protein
LKPRQLDRKLDRLVEQLAGPIGPEVRLSVDSFSEAEKSLFRRVDKIAEEYRQAGSSESLLGNSELINKSLEVFLRRVRAFYCHAVSRVLGCGEVDGVFEYFFRLYFYNFEADLKDCLTRVGSWSKKDREEFATFLKDNKGCFFRVPRDLNDIESLDLNDLEESDNEMEETRSE